MEHHRLVPIINNRDELKTHISTLYIINDYMTDYTRYRRFQKDIYNVVKGCFDIAECREYPIKFKFYRDDPVTYTLQLRHFLFNIYTWLPFVELHEFKIMNEYYIFDCSKDIIKVNEYLETKLVDLMTRYHLKNKTKNILISKILDDFRKVSDDFGLYLGMELSADTFISVYNNNDVVREMMTRKFDETKQPYEIEQELNEIQHNLLLELKSLSGNNVLKMILRSGTGIKAKQLIEFMVSEGFKPGLDGKTIPYQIQNSTLIGGLDRPSYVYLDATGGRKSLIMNNKVMGRAGYYGKIIIMLARTLVFDPYVDDCGTKHLVKYTINNKKFLEKLKGKYYTTDPDTIDLSIIDINDTSLIGQTVYVRSPATCALGNKLCAKCLGHTWQNIRTMMDGFSVMFVEEWTKVINQNILSTKHLLTTNSEMITFNDDFYKFFNILSGEITPKMNNNSDIENIEDYAIYIEPEAISKIEEMDDDSLYNTIINTGKFWVRNIKDPTQDDIMIYIENEKDIFISEEFMEAYDQRTGLAKLSDFTDDTKLFEIDIQNNELTKPLYSIMHLTNKEKSDSVEAMTVHDMCQRFVELLIESSIGVEAVSVELIVNRLLYSYDNPYRRPNFRHKTLEPYGIQTVTKALLNNESPLLGLSYQNLKQQVVGGEALYDEKKATSYIDDAYDKTINAQEIIENIEDDFDDYSDIIN